MIPIRIYNALEMAAEIRGESLNHFIIQAAFEKAKTIIDQERIIELSQQDAERFFQAIDNPPEASEKLVEAFRAYKGKFADAEDRTAQQEPQ